MVVCGCGSVCVCMYVYGSVGVCGSVRCVSVCEVRECVDVFVYVYLFVCVCLLLA